MTTNGGVNMSMINEEAMLQEALICPRCHGLMIYEYATNVEHVLPIVRCVNCGEIVDDRILRNRMAQQAPWDLMGSL